MSAVAIDFLQLSGSEDQWGYKSSAMRIQSRMNLAYSSLSRARKPEGASLVKRECMVTSRNSSEPKKLSCPISCSVRDHLKAKTIASSWTEKEEEWTKRRISGSGGTDVELYRAIRCRAIRSKAEVDTHFISSMTPSARVVGRRSRLSKWRSNHGLRS